MSEVGFIDSTGIGVPMLARRRADDEGAVIVLRALTGPARRAPRVAGLDAVFAFDHGAGPG